MIELTLYSKVGVGHIEWGGGSEKKKREKEVLDIDPWQARKVVV